MRVPPPIRSSASSTVTPTPFRASSTAQASPLGPEPTTIASLNDSASSQATPRPDGERLLRATAPPSTTTGKSKDSSSQGWLVTMSFTATVPSSRRPSTGSQTS